MRSFRSVFCLLLSFSLYHRYAVAVLPPSIPTCSHTLSTNDRNECWRSAAELVIRNFDANVRTGEIKLVEPFTIDPFIFGKLEYGQNFKITNENFIIEGISKLKITKVNGAVGDGKISFRANFYVENAKSSSIKADIDWDFKLLTIKRDCFVDIDYGKIEMILDIQGDIVKRNNTNFVLVNSVKLNMKVHSMKMNFKGLFGFKFMNNLANYLLNSNAELMLKFSIPEIESLMRVKAKNLANIFFASYSADELFP